MRTSTVCAAELPVDSDWPAQPYATNWYVVCMDGNRISRLLGPYDRAATAIANLGKAHDLAEQADPWSVFYTFAIGNLPLHISKPGVLMHLV